HSKPLVDSHMPLGDTRPLERAGGLPLRELVDHLAAGVVVARGEDGAVTYVNPATHKILGWEVPLGMTIAHYADLPFLHADGRRLRGEELPLAQALRSGRPVRGEIAVERPDGRRRTIQIAATPLGGEPASVVAVLEDVTALHEG